jgi:hypothetical protein
MIEGLERLRTASQSEAEYLTIVFMRKIGREAFI